MNAPSAPKKEQLILLVSCFIPDMLLNLSSNLGYVHTYEKYLKKYQKAPVPANKGTRLLLLKINQCLPSPPSHLRTKARLAKPPSCCLLPTQPKSKSKSMRKCIPEGRIWLNFQLHLSNSASIALTKESRLRHTCAQLWYALLRKWTGHLAWDVGGIQLAFQTVSLARQGPCLWCCTIQILRRQCLNLNILKLIVSLSSCVQFALAF